MINFISSRLLHPQVLFVGWCSGFSKVSEQNLCLMLFVDACIDALEPSVKDFMPHLSHASEETPHHANQQVMLAEEQVQQFNGNHFFATALWKHFGPFCTPVAAKRFTNGKWTAKRGSVRFKCKHWKNQFLEQQFPQKFCGPCGYLRFQVEKKHREKPVAFRRSDCPLASAWAKEHLQETNEHPVSNYWIIFDSVPIPNHGLSNLNQFSLHATVHSSVLAKPSTRFLPKVVSKVPALRTSQGLSFVSCWDPARRYTWSNWCCWIWFNVSVLWRFASLPNFLRQLHFESPKVFKSKKLSCMWGQWFGWLQSFVALASGWGRLPGGVISFFAAHDSVSCSKWSERVASAAKEWSFVAKLLTANAALPGLAICLADISPSKPRLDCENDGSLAPKLWLRTNLSHWETPGLGPNDWRLHS